MTYTIIGIDPGSQCTGYGVIHQQGSRIKYLDCGQITCPQTQLANRLLYIYQHLTEIIQRYQPSIAAVEQVFTHLNPQTALKLGQARGAALTALASANCEVYEYTARQVKQAIVGYGAAAKQQVQQMVKTLLNLNSIPATDAADALAVAICHGQHQNYQLKITKALDKAGDLK